MTAPYGRDPRDDRDDDAVFRQIVAGFETDTHDVVPRWPVSEDVHPDAPPHTPEPAQTESRGLPEDEGLPDWVEPDALPDDGHYEPPPPPRLPRPRARTLLALVVAVLGFAVLFFPFRVGLDDSAGSMVLGMLLVAGGAVLLVRGMRDAPGADDRPDDGAVV